MKTYKNLYSQVYDFANPSVAYRRARRGKQDRAALAGFEFEAERNRLCLQVELKVLWA